VTESVRAKARIVAEDERETTGAPRAAQPRHTFGHALEAQTGFSERLLHGEGVALGMVLAARYSARRGYYRRRRCGRVTAAIDAAGLPCEVAALGLNAGRPRACAHMLHDKKMDAGTCPSCCCAASARRSSTSTLLWMICAEFLDEELQAH
jgi:3-dehydroquinate synthase